VIKLCIIPVIPTVNSFHPTHFSTLHQCHIDNWQHKTDVSKTSCRCVYSPSPCTIPHALLHCFISYCHQTESQILILCYFLPKKLLIQTLHIFERCVTTQTEVICWKQHQCCLHFTSSRSHHVGITDNKGIQLTQSFTKSTRYIQPLFYAHLLYEFLLNTLHK
jgi:hypothetical protein